MTKIYVRWIRNFFFFLSLSLRFLLIMIFFRFCFALFFLYPSICFSIVFIYQVYEQCKRYSTRFVCVERWYNCSISLFVGRRICIDTLFSASILNYNKINNSIFLHPFRFIALYSVHIRVLYTQKTSLVAYAFFSISALVLRYFLYMSFFCAYFAISIYTLRQKNRRKTSRSTKKEKKSFISCVGSNLIPVHNVNPSLHFSELDTQREIIVFVIPT